MSIQNYSFSKCEGHLLFGERIADVIGVGKDGGLQVIKKDERHSRMADLLDETTSKW